MSSTVSSLQQSQAQAAEIVTGFQDSQVLNCIQKMATAESGYLTACETAVLLIIDFKHVWRFYYKPGCHVKPFPYAIPFNHHDNPTKQVL